MPVLLGAWQGVVSEVVYAVDLGPVRLACCACCRVHGPWSPTVAAARSTAIEYT